MTDFDYGPLQTYEITWKSGHVERLQDRKSTRQNSSHYRESRMPSSA